MRLLITLCLLVFTHLMVTTVEAAPRTHSQASLHRPVKKLSVEEVRRKRKPIKTALHKNRRVVAHKTVVARHKTSKLAKKIASSRNNNLVIKSHQRHPKLKKLAPSRTKLNTSQLAEIRMDAKHRQRYQKARQTAMSKLMKQLGKPYSWGGVSPKTGFDCSGLVYYAYKDLLKFKLPRTANDMYHLRDAAPVKRTQLQKGDLVFFRLNSSSRADHVGVYLGNGKFIQSPRTGKDIQISELTQAYWQNHYIGARRMMTPNTIR